MRESMDKRNKTIRLFLIFLFFAILCLPVLQMQFRFCPEPENCENRELAQAPTEDCSLAEYADGWERYLVDNFGFRPYLIRWNSMLKLTGLGVSPVSSVILGKDSWLFYHSEALADGNTVNDWRGTIPLSQSELVRLQEQLEANEKIFAERNIPYLVVIVPNKSTVYSEYMPDTIRKFRNTTRLDQFMEHMRRSSRVSVLDLREALFEAKNSHPLYWKTDSHWNSYGAYIGYSEIMRRLSAQLPALTPVPIAGNEVTIEHSPTGGDLAQMLFLQDSLPEENETRLNLETIPTQPALDTLVLRHDSFGDALYPYFHRHFKNLVNIAPFAPYRFQSIFEKCPQAVVHVFAERYITQAIHDDFYYEEARP
jgi:alginate O-acetyltransferase complex protein AlgJ